MSEEKELEVPKLVDENTKEISGLQISKLTNTILGTLYLRKTDTSELIKLKNNEGREVMKTLLDDGKISHKEFYEANNFLNIAEIADSKYKCSLKNEETYDFDWFMRFFDAVGNISNSELQELWAKVLVGEVQTPGSCSLRTLDMIRNMSVSEARMFEKLARLIVRSGDMHFIFPTGFYDQDCDECRRIIETLGINYSDWIMPMFEVGAMTGEHELAAHLKTGDTVHVMNDSVVSIMSNTTEQLILFEQEAYELTRSGAELYDIVRNGEAFEADEEYFISCLRVLKETHPEINVAAYRITNIDDKHPLDLIQL